jgi:hypothetical protein
MLRGEVLLSQSGHSTKDAQYEYVTQFVTQFGNFCIFYPENVHGTNLTRLTPLFLANLKGGNISDSCLIVQYTHVQSREQVSPILQNTMFTALYSSSTCILYTRAAAPLRGDQLDFWGMRALG